MISQHFNHPVDHIELLDNYGWNRCRIAYEFIGRKHPLTDRAIRDLILLEPFTTKQIQIMAEAYEHSTI